MFLKNVSSYQSHMVSHPGLDSRCYQILRVAVGLEWDSLRLVRINEELLETRSSGSCLEN
jgi:hypothetical protein